MWARTILISLALTSAAAAQEDGPPPALSPPAVSAEMSAPEIGRAMDVWLGQLQRDGVFNGNVLLAHNGREIYLGAFGATDVGGAVALNADTRFPIASINKVFTQVAIEQLIAAGRLTPETTIADVLPDYPTALSRGATVAQLIDHRGGIADIFGHGDPDESATPMTSNHDYYALVSQAAPEFAPGAEQRYCNGCYVVLGEMIERITGGRYEDYIAQHVFAPTGMSGAAFLRHDQLPANVARFTGRPRGDGLEDVSRFHGVAGSAAGNSYASARDLLAFDNALREHRLLGAEATARVLRSRPETARATARIGFAGGAPGVNAMLYGNGEWTLVILTNRPPPTAEAINQAVFPLLAGPRAS